MAAAMTGASRATGTELNQGDFDHLTVRYFDGVLVVKEAGPFAILAALLAPGMDTSIAMMKLNEVGSNVADILEDLR